MMSWLWSDPAIQLAALLALAVVFIGGAVGKFAALAEFAGVVANYRILPEPLVLPFARGIPALELAGGLALLVPGLRFAGAGGLSALLVVFTLAIVINLVRGRTHIDCGCFNLAARQTISWWLVARNVGVGVLLAVALVPAGARLLGPLDIVSGVAAAVVMAVLYVATPMLGLGRLARDANFDQLNGAVEEVK